MTIKEIVEKVKDALRKIPGLSKLVSKPKRKRRK